MKFNKSIAVLALSLTLGLVGCNEVPRKYRGQYHSSDGSRLLVSRDQAQLEKDGVTYSAQGIRYGFDKVFEAILKQEAGIYIMPSMVELSIVGIEIPIDPKSYPFGAMMRMWPDVTRLQKFSKRYLDVYAVFPQGSQEGCQIDDPSLLPGTDLGCVRGAGLYFQIDRELEQKTETLDVAFSPQVSFAAAKLLFFSKLFSVGVDKESVSKIQLNRVSKK